MPARLPPHLHHERTRHGRMVWYVRAGHGRRVRIAAAYDTPEFWAEYRAAIEGKAPAVPAGPKAHTLAWALNLYRASSRWSALSPATRRQRENIFRIMIAAAGDRLLTKFEPSVILGIRERRADSPHAANNFLKALRPFFAWAADAKEGGGLLKSDPAAGVALLRGRNPAGYHTWSEEEVARYEAQTAEPSGNSREFPHPEPTP